MIHDIILKIEINILKTNIILYVYKANTRNYDLLILYDSMYFAVFAHWKLEIGILVTSILLINADISRGFDIEIRIKLDRSIIEYIFHDIHKKKNIRLN
jgi:hypothetical protein